MRLDIRMPDGPHSEPDTTMTVDNAVKGGAGRPSADIFVKGGARRPSADLFDEYVRYKQDTRAVIAWLTRHGSNTRDCGCATGLTIPDLFRLAAVVQAKGMRMSDTIAFHFRAAIAGRARLSKSFRKRNLTDGGENRETCNHEYFTAR